MCLVPRCSCSSLLIIHLSRGKSDVEGPEEEVRELLLSAGMAIGCVELGGKSWRMQSWSLQLRAPRLVSESCGDMAGMGMMDANESTRDAEGCSGCWPMLCSLSEASIPMGSLGWALSIPLHKLPTIVSEDGVGRSWEAALEGGTGILLHAIPPVYHSKVPFRSLHIHSHPCAKGAKGVVEPFPFTS